MTMNKLLITQFSILALGVILAAALLHLAL